MRGQDSYLIREAKHQMYSYTTYYIYTLKSYFYSYIPIGNHRNEYIKIAQNTPLPMRIARAETAECRSRPAGIGAARRRLPTFFGEWANQNKTAPSRFCRVGSATDKGAFRSGGSGRLFLLKGRLNGIGFCAHPM